jgi:hypothetical protein
VTDQKKVGNDLTDRLSSLASPQLPQQLDLVSQKRAPTGGHGVPGTCHTEDRSSRHRCRVIRDALFPLLLCSARPRKLYASPFVSPFISRLGPKTVRVPVRLPRSSPPSPAVLCSARKLYASPFISPARLANCTRPRSFPRQAQRREAFSRGRASNPPSGPRRIGETQIGSSGTQSQSVRYNTR